MNIRKAELMDLNYLAELFDQYRVFYKKNSDVESTRLFLKTRIKKKESEIFVSFNNEGKMTGFTQLYSSFSSTTLKRFWVLNDLFVHQDFRRQGYSIALIEKAK
ncbi:MAG TPA: GNAT family N-acetyltransferase [Cyclobacteriaceae bacterium]